MIKQKKYFNLIQQLPVLNPPDNLNKIILEKCNINPQISKGIQDYISQISYGIACIVVIISIFVMASSQSIPSNTTYLIIADNSKSLITQLADSSYMLLTEQNK